MQYVCPFWTCSPSSLTSFRFATVIFLLIKMKQIRRSILFKKTMLRLHTFFHWNAHFTFLTISTNGDKVCLNIHIFSLELRLMSRCLHRTVSIFNKPNECYVKFSKRFEVMKSSLQWNFSRRTWSISIKFPPISKDFKKIAILSQRPTIDEVNELVCGWSVTDFMFPTPRYLF